MARQDLVLKSFGSSTMRRRSLLLGSVMASVSPVFEDPPKNPSLHGIRTRLLNFALQFLALLLVTVLPAFVTTIPFVAASSIQFERVEGRVTALTKRHIFFVIPYRTVRVDPVTDIASRTHAGSVTRERRTGQTDKYRQADSQGYLVVNGPGASSEIPANASKLESLKQQSEAFLRDPQAGELKLYLLGNPTFSIVFGGGATAVTLLFAGCCLYAVGKWLLKLAGLSPTRNRERRRAGRT